MQHILLLEADLVVDDLLEQLLLVVLVAVPEVEN